METLDEANITDAVLARFAGDADRRLKQVLTSLITHVHSFAREVDLTPEEWQRGIEFLTEVGHATDDKRQEFIVLSDTVGFSALVDLIANRGKPRAATESSLLGPFFREGAPEMAMGASIAREIQGEPLMLRGRVLSTEGTAIADALVDVWQGSPEGLYDVQVEGSEMNLRGRFRTDREGRFRLMSVKPSSYPVPHDGPVGRMLEALGQHPYRPAHIHFKLSARGCRPLVTALYIDGDKYLESDAVFGCRSPLVVKYSRSEGQVSGDVGKVDTIEFNFVLESEGQRPASG